ncbi:NUDIX hydrolase [Fusibacter ferrireducens]|uniref:NUDIX hydrolase n=1 Tax=Fusibacter ferrireducens TaxID=2785058 RepID=A0ABR9ZNX4_9FIRM|nr:NUDIX hydrolase [Fusibacter ferrireducens]MBF4692016.1 NUDIX hydrolase [Fusibacter ferrireducens]
MEPKWLTWSKELQSIAQNGLTYTKDAFDKERFQRIRDISVEIIHEYTDMDQKKIKDLFCNEKGYQTPKVDVRGVIYTDHKILLVREKSDGKWSLPGGWADYNLSIKENVMKEIEEEAGLVVKPIKLIALLNRNMHNQPVTAYGVYKAFVQCEVKEGSFKANVETEESGFFEMDKLPTLSSGRVTKEQLKMCVDSIVNDVKYTLFD